MANICNTCGEGWAPFYTKVIEAVEEHDKAQSCEENKIGLIRVFNSNGSIGFQFSNEGNIPADIKHIIDGAKASSGKTCEYCGTTTKVGLATEWQSKCFHHTRCCNDCWKKKVLPIYNKSIWAELPCNKTRTEDVAAPTSPHNSRLFIQFAEFLGYQSKLIDLTEDKKLKGTFFDNIFQTEAAVIFNEMRKELSSEEIRDYWDKLIPIINGSSSDPTLDLH